VFVKHHEVPLMQGRAICAALALQETCINRNNSRREHLTADIIEEVKRVVREELCDSSITLSAEARQAVENEILGHTNHILEALSSEEMASEGALVSHLANARLGTQRIIRDRRPPTGSASAKGNQS
jgi:hypothetical protein